QTIARRRARIPARHRCARGPAAIHQCLARPDHRRPDRHWPVCLALAAQGRQAMSTVAGAMRRRTLIILGMAAGASALLGAASFIPPGEELPRSEVGQRVLPAFESKAGLVALVMVTTGEESYHLVKNDDGWVMPEKGNYPVSDARIRELTDALSSMTYARPMTHDEKKFDR